MSDNKLILPDYDDLDADRRGFLSQTSKATLSATAIALLAGCSTMATGDASGGSTEQDISTLNAALAAEYEAIAAYQMGAESGLLNPNILKLTTQFQGHHKQHAELLINTVSTLGGQASQPQSSYNFSGNPINNPGDVIRLVAGLEQGAISAYLGAVPVFKDRALAKTAASILGDEAMHWAVLRIALREDPVPVAFVS